MSGPLVTPFMKKVSSVNKAGVFDGGIYGSLGIHSEYRIQNFELDLGLNVKTLSGAQCFASIEVGNDANQGIQIWNEGSALNVYIQGLRYSQALSIGLIDISVMGYDGTYYVYVNESLVDSDTYPTITYGGASFTGVATRAGNFRVVDSEYSLFEYYELDSSGNRINKFIRLDWNNGGINICPNIAADKPANPNMIWTPAGSGTYVEI